jgi:hypothetical protein
MEGCALAAPRRRVWRGATVAARRRNRADRPVRAWRGRTISAASSGVGLEEWRDRAVRSVDEESRIRHHLLPRAAPVATGQPIGLESACAIVGRQGIDPKELAISARCHTHAAMKILRKPAASYCCPPPS